MYQNIRQHLKGFSLPMLVGVYPVIFLYSINTHVLQPGSLVQPLVIALAAAAVAYGLSFFFQMKIVPASFSAAILMVFFSSYGILYQQLHQHQRFPIDHLVLLPLALVAAGCLAYAASFIPPEIAAGMHTILRLVMLGLVCFNVLVAAPTEIRKARLQQVSRPGREPAASSPAGQKSPDIYYIILDEYAGLDAIRGYWHENYVDQFEAFMQENGFFVAGNSHSKSTSTLLELNSRLNLHYPNVTDGIVLTEDITENKILKMAKSHGYTTVVISQGFPPFRADYNFTYSGARSQGFGAAEFRQRLLENSMLFAFADRFPNNDAELARQREAILYGFNKTTNLAEVASPRFVFTYIPFPHMPFIVDQDGRLLDQKFQSNWNYYLGQHRFATQQAVEMIARLLKDADPQNPPVIILQSDHGARNVDLATADSVTLENYPREYQTLILNALYLPGYDSAKLTEDISPIRTLEIVLRHYLEEKN